MTMANGKFQSDFPKSETISSTFHGTMHPSLKYQHTTRFNFKSSNCLKSFEVNENDLLLIIKNLNTIKARGWYDISVWMMQSCGKSCIFTKAAFYKNTWKGNISRRMEKVILLSTQKRVQECDKKVSTYQSFSHI